LLTSACCAQADRRKAQEIPTVLKNDLVLDMLIPPVLPYPRIRPAFIFPNLELPRFFRQQELQLEAGNGRACWLRIWRW
jgi:hypothetical protein